ncbi:MAG: NADH-quinone oxidoreductase subunit NuoG [Porticoccaceae bacterium]|nr:NADH-quinone oxidoreductase subunit NuoG [Porticoccaceae bacterium]
MIIFVDGQEIEVKQGENVLEACLNAGLDLPYFCWHPAMGSIGSCRQCALVQYQNPEDTRGRIVMGCMTQVTDGARFSLNAQNATEFREAVVESLMLNHPHDCPVCAEGGECHLQDMTVMVGHRDRRYTGKKNTHRNQYLGPLIQHEMNRCITCYRCERYYRDYAGGSDLGAQASRDHVYFGRHQEGVLESEFSGNLVEVCPTGVFTDKPFLKHYSRKWDLQSAPSICSGCGVGCNISPGERYGKLKRVHNRYNHEVNGYFLCDRGRFGSGYINSDQRLDYSGLKGAGLKSADATFAAVHQSQAIETAAGWLQGKKVLGIGSPRASLESNYLLRELVGRSNFSSGFSDAEAAVVRSIINIQKTTVATNPTIKQMESADAILILGEDITNTAPRVALALRQALRNKSFELAEQLGLPEWQDAAVRNLAQDQLSPMVIVSAMDSRLDDVASQLISLSPAAIADFSCAVTASLQGQESDDKRVQQVANMLSAAKRPLIISGSSMLSANIVDSAACLAEALQAHKQAAQEVMLSFCVPEANSMGLGLLVNEDKRPLRLSRLAKKIDTVDAVLILENDLERRLSQSELDLIFSGKTRVISMDLLENNTLARSDLVLPVASYAESQGTLVNAESRAQRHYPVFEPAAERLCSWQWLLQLAAVMEHKKLAGIAHFDQIVEACSKSQPIFADLTAVAPDHSFRDRGLKVPRQTHRYSGRTAINADVSVHEPPQPTDCETPLAYSMEGLNRDQPASLIPYVWSPGWNSNQSLQKFQAEVNGPLKGALKHSGAGQRLIKSTQQGLEYKLKVTHPRMQKGRWQLLPMHRVHGSEELSAYTDEIAELAAQAFVALGETVAEKLGVAEGEMVVVSTADQEISLQVKVLSRVAKNCVGFSVGYDKTKSLRAGDSVALRRDKSWQPPQVIATDRGVASNGC